MKTIGKVIKGLRQKNGLSQETLGKEIGIDRSMISRWENDVLLPSEDNLRLICDFFKVDISVFDIDENEDKEEHIAETPSEPIKHPKEETKKNDDSIRDSVIILAAGIMCLDLSPYSAPVCLFLILYSIKKKLHPVMILFSIYTLLYAVDDIFFAFGIDLLPRIWR